MRVGFQILLSLSLFACTQTSSSSGSKNVGEACTGNGQCSSDLCISVQTPAGENDQYCTERCDAAACPNGFRCQAANGGSVCVRDGRMIGGEGEGEGECGEACSIFADCSVAVCPNFDNSVHPQLVDSCAAGCAMDPSLAQGIFQAAGNCQGLIEAIAQGNQQFGEACGIGGGPPPGGLGTCGGIFDCFGDCPQGDQNCPQACVGAASQEGQQQFDAVQQCLQRTGCLDVEPDTCQEDCGAEIDLCFGVGVGNDPCGTVLDCIVACDNNECARECFFDGTQVAQDDFNSLVDCLNMNMCMDVNCPQCVAEFNACQGN